ncbi:hypothetical protein [Hydrogenophaga sp. PAMC20947]|uniref:hypothetical protein n=1 Tax=Hydrogenophaga sp. PAMC20947 TaxID=2565558 RepID=UPI00109DF4C9|nr:hypothetical protein [Hydrogenophaga sp. PAMC20947]QCB45791.1 hypothetical protein E5678_07010 [Hydrogenophaga sp. PAMC20947]
MLYTKTPQAWSTLPHPDVLGREAHTVILMANGRRSLRELSLLIGSDVTDLAFELCESGYLQPAAPAAQEQLLNE